MPPQLRSAARGKRPIDEVDDTIAEVRQPGSTPKRRRVTIGRKGGRTSRPSQTSVEPNRDSHEADTTYRLKHIPARWGGKNEIITHLKDTLGLGNEVSVRIFSVSESPLSSDERVATLSFVPRPSALLPERSVRGSGNEWRFHISCSGGPDTDTYLTVDKNFFGITPFHHAADHECVIDIVALSGLNGHAFGSFKERGGSFMWLRDALPKALPQARVFAYGYDTSIVNSNSFQKLLDLGMQFRETLRIIRNQKPSPSLKRPLIVIGHSLGGLVAKEAIIQMASSQAHEADQTNLQSICGILLFGVPSQGMGIESLLPMALDQPNEGFLYTLGKDSDVLRHQQQDFPRAFQFKDSRIYSFYETMESPTAIKVNGKWTMSGPPARLVDIASATHGRFHEETQQPYVHPINRSHSEMIKFAAKDDQDFLTILDRLQTLLDDAARILSHRHLNSSSANTQRVQNLEEQACLKSLSFMEQTSRQDEILDAKLNGTCTWLKSNQAYLTWTSSRTGSLWIQGKPGSGKSTLMKYALEDVESNFCGKKEVIASFFVHGRGSAIQKTPIGVFRSLLNQLLAQVPELLKALTKEYQARCRKRGSYGDWVWEIGLLKSFIAENIPKATRDRPIIICIDALDEFEDNVAAKIIQYFEDLISATAELEGSLRILFSCRYYPVLVSNRCSSIYLEQENQDDIRSTLERILQKSFSAERGKIVDVLSQRAQGVFQWATLVGHIITDLKTKGYSFNLIWKRMEATPAELHNLYDILLDQVSQEERGETIKLFQWMLFSTGPLTILELQLALAVDSTTNCGSIRALKKADWYIENLDDLTRLINHLSRGLLEIVIRETMFTMDRREAQFIHQSVPDYLLNSGLKKLEHGATGSPAGRGHLEISRSCIRYLQTKDIMSRDPYSYRLGEEHPLAEYSLKNYIIHLAEAEKEGILQPDLLSLFSWPSEPPYFDQWEVLTRANIYPSRTQIPGPGSSLIHLLAIAGVDSAVQHMVNHPILHQQRQAEKYLDPKNQKHETPLYLALYNGNFTTALMLLSSHATFNLSPLTYNNRSTLHLIMDTPWEDVPVGLLLDVIESLAKRGADLNSKDYLGLSPLGMISDLGCSVRRFRTKSPHSEAIEGQVTKRLIELGAVREVGGKKVRPVSTDQFDDLSSHLLGVGGWASGYDVSDVSDASVSFSDKSFDVTQRRELQDLSSTVEQPDITEDVESELGFPLSLKVQPFFYEPCAECGGQRDLRYCCWLKYKDVWAFVDTVGTWRKESDQWSAETQSSQLIVVSGVREASKQSFDVSETLSPVSLDFYDIRGLDFFLDHERFEIFE